MYNIWDKPQTTGKHLYKNGEKPGEGNSDPKRSRREKVFHRELEQKTEADKARKVLGCKTTLGRQLGRKVLSWKERAVPTLIVNVKTL